MGFFSRLGVSREERVPPQLGAGLPGCVLAPQVWSRRPKKQKKKASNHTQIGCLSAGSYGLIISLRASSMSLLDTAWQGAGLGHPGMLLLGPVDL